MFKCNPCGKPMVPLDLYLHWDTQNRHYNLQTPDYIGTALCDGYHFFVPKHFRALVNFTPPQWSCASRNPCMWSSHPRVSVFISNIYELDYPHIIHTLSAHYPHIIHTLSTCCLSYMKRPLECVLRCRHVPTGPKRVRSVWLLDWHGQGDGCHTHGQGLARWQWPGTLHAI